MHKRVLKIQMGKTIYTKLFTLP